MKRRYSCQPDTSSNPEFFRAWTSGRWQRFIMVQKAFDERTYKVTEKRPVRRLDHPGFYRLVEWCKARAAEGVLDHKTHEQIAEKASAELDLPVSPTSVGQVRRDMGVKWIQAVGGAATQGNFFAQVKQRMNAMEDVLAFVLKDLYSDKELPTEVRDWFIKMRHDREQPPTGD